MTRGAGGPQPPSASAVTGPELLRAARSVALRAYAPYSNFRVGAAVAAGGAVFCGVNVENASFGLTLCAERAAVLAAVSAGNRRIEAVAVACIDAGGSEESTARLPCGACRQVLAEFASDACPVWVEGGGRYELGQLLPQAFRLG